MTDIHPLVRLAQQFTLDWLNRADADVPARIMRPDYLVHISEIELAGPAAYTRATVGQLRQFPGLMLTVHEVLTDGHRLCLAFTEHGGSARHDGRAAAWAGIALFDWDGERLAENWTQEDYYARRRQLADGRPDVIAAPAVAPWTTSPRPANPAAEATVRDWLAAPTFGAVRLDDGSQHEPAIIVEAAEIHRLFSAGDRVAFAASWSGRYRGGLAGVAEDRQPATLGIAGVLTVRENAVLAGTLVTDRLGLRRSLLGS